MADLLKPYCSVSDVQIETRNSDSANDNTYKECINAASREIDDFCLRDFWFHDHAASPIAIRPAWVVGKSIYFPWPIVTLTAITSAGAALDMASMMFFEGDREVECSSRFESPSAGRPLTATGTFGYPLAETDPLKTAPATIPGGVRRACALIAAAWSGFLSRDRMTMDGQKVSLLDNRIPLEAKQLLARYKLDNSI